MTTENPWGLPEEPDQPTRAGPKWSFGISPNFLFLVAICAALAVALALVPALTGPFTFLFIAAAWVLSVVLHEFGHALVAYLAGDKTVVGKGYLTLDPLKYTDLGVTLIFPLIALALGGIGFPGAAVYLRPDLMRSRIGRSLASLAGPAMTLVVLVLLSLALPWVSSPAVSRALCFLAFLQATALILNLLPVPGLDGYGVIRPFLPVSWQRAMKPWEGLSMLLLFAAIFFLPQVSGLLFVGAFSLANLLGVPIEAIAQGWSAFTFWKAVGIG